MCHFRKTAVRLAYHVPLTLKSVLETTTTKEETVKEKKKKKKKKPKVITQQASSAQPTRRQRIQMALHGTQHQQSSVTESLGPDQAERHNITAMVSANSEPKSKR